MDQTFKYIADYGLAVVMLVIIVYAYNKQNKRIMDESKAREERQINESKIREERLIQVITDSIKNMNANFLMLQADIKQNESGAIEARKRIAEADKYQRDEHDKIMGCQEKQTEFLQAMLTQLKILNKQPII